MEVHRRIPDRSCISSPGDAWLAALFFSEASISPKVNLCCQERHFKNWCIRNNSLLDAHLGGWIHSALLSPLLWKQSLPLFSSSVIITETSLIQMKRQLLPEHTRRLTWMVKPYLPFQTQFISKLFPDALTQGCLLPPSSGILWYFLCNCSGTPTVNGT